jgi:1-acyl-sn-glycerol-3-phosphate acyltransferase
MPPTTLPTRPWRDPLRWLVAPWTVVVWYPIVLATTAFWGLAAVLLSLASRRLGFYSGAVWAWCLCWASFVRVRVEGREHAPRRRSFVILSNHQGNYDILALYGFLGRQFRWVIKEELRRVPFLGWGCAAIGHIFVDRRDPRRAIASLDAAKPDLVDGVSVVFFPEGTRSDDGRLGRFKKGGFMMARQLELPILPISISGSARILPKGCLFPRPGVLRVRLHPPIEVADFAPGDALVEQVRRVIASGLRPEEQPPAT